MGEPAPHGSDCALHGGKFGMPIPQKAKKFFCLALTRRVLLGCELLLMVLMQKAIWRPKRLCVGKSRVLWSERGAP